MQTSVSMKSIEAAQAERASDATLLRKIMSTSRESNEHLSPAAQHGAGADTLWRAWIKREKMWRLAYMAWVIDSQFTLFFDLDPLIPTDLMSAPLPCHDRVWEAPTAVIWENEVNRQGQLLQQRWGLSLSGALTRVLLGTYQPRDLRCEKEYVYRFKTRRDGLGDFATLVLLLAVFGDVRLMQNRPPSAFSTTSSLELRSGWVETALEYLDIICPDEQSPPTDPSLKPALMHHKHLIGLLMHISLRDVFCFSGWRVTLEDALKGRQRLKLWFVHNRNEARRAVLHAGRLFALLRTASAGGHYEPRGMLIACLMLWANAELVNDDANEYGACEKVVPIRLDRSLDKTAVQDWLDGHAAQARPYLAGVGAISGNTAAGQIVREGARIMESWKAWPIGHVMGVVMKIYHSMLSLPEIQSLY